MAKYTAQHIEGHRYLVIKRRLFGLLSPVYREAEWDGYTYSSTTKPDFHWVNSKNEKTDEAASFRPRWALIKEWKRVRGLVPADWSHGLPTAKLLVKGEG